MMRQEQRFWKTVVVTRLNSYLLCALAEMFMKPYPSDPILGWYCDFLTQKIIQNNFNFFILLKGNIILKGRDSQKITLFLKSPFLPFICFFTHYSWNNNTMDALLTCLLTTHTSHYWTSKKKKKTILNNFKFCHISKALFFRFLYHKIQNSIWQMEDPPQNPEEKK